MSQPQLVSLATSYNKSIPSLSVAIIYEHVLGNEIHRYGVRAFPTYILFESSKEYGRVEGVNFPGIQELVDSSGAANRKPSAWDSGTSQGHSLGSITSQSADDVKAARLARLTMLEQQNSGSRIPTKEFKVENAVSTENPTEMEGPTIVDPPSDELVDPASNLDPSAIEVLTTSMGFSLIRAQKGLLYGGNTTDGAVEWLLAHQDDDDIDIPIPLQRHGQSLEGAEGMQKLISAAFHIAVF